MKKRRLLFICLGVVLLCILSGCSSVSKGELETLSIEKQTLMEENKALEEKNQALVQENKTLTENNKILAEELDFLKNGADNQLVIIRNAFEMKEYDQVIKLSTALHNDFNGFPQDDEAQELSQKSQEILEQIELEKKAEEERLAAEAAKSAQDKAREILRISKISFDMDSAGGVDVYINWQNNSEKTIKYAYFTVSPINAVGDEVLNHDKYDATSNLKSTGPFKEGEGDSSSTYWPTVWYNATTDTVKLEKVCIEYMDGTSITLTKEDVNYIQY